MESVTTALKSSFTTIGDSLTGVIGDILPIALPVVGAVLVVTLGIGIFKKVTKKA